MSDLQVVAVLPAAGTGTRMQIPVPKQFCLIHNRPVISHTLQAFERASLVKHIIVVVSEDNIEHMRELLLRFSHNMERISLITGGETRHRSIQSGVLAAEKMNPDVLVIHDGVRPFVPESIIREVAHAAHIYGAAGAVRPLVSTVVQPDATGFLDQSLDRSKYRNSEMPQAFQYSVIRQAYKKCSAYDLDFGTECLQLALKYCETKAQLIDGPDCLWKVTHSKDLHTAHGVLRDSSCELSVEGHIDEYFSPVLDYLKKENITIVISSNEKSFTCCTLTVLEGEMSSLPLTNTSCLEVQIFLFMEPKDVHCVGHFEHLVQLAAKSTSCCVFGFIVKVKSPCHIPVIASILASLLKDRNKVFSGQTFKV